MFFIAWVVVGFCSYLLIKNERYKVLGENHCAKYMFVKDPECKEVSEDVFGLTGEKLLSKVNSAMEFVLALIYTVIAPLAMYKALKLLFVKDGFDRVKEVISQYKE